MSHSGAAIRLPAQIAGTVQGHSPSYCCKLFALIYHRFVYQRTAFPLASANYTAPDPPNYILQRLTEKASKSERVNMTARWTGPEYSFARIFTNGGDRAPKAVVIFDLEPALS